MKVEWHPVYMEYDTEGTGKVKATKLHWQCVASNKDELAEEGGEFIERRSYGVADISGAKRVYAMSSLHKVPPATLVKWIHTALGPEGIKMAEEQALRELDEALHPKHGGFAIVDVKTHVESTPQPPDIDS